MSNATSQMSSLGCLRLHGKQASRRRRRPAISRPVAAAMLGGGHKGTIQSGGRTNPAYIPNQQEIVDLARSVDRRS
jgi:hypothetical protein